MDWSKVKSAIGTIAPWLAGTLGTPVAGVAVKVICDIFGLSGSSATPENVTAALAGATPNQLIALKQADLKHQEFMTQIGYDHLDKMAAIDAGDRDSARKREISVRGITTPALAWLVVTASVSLGAAIIMGVVTKDPTQATLVGTVIGYVFSEAKQVLAYYFGSSVGSDRKTELLAQSTPAQQ